MTPIEENMYVFAARYAHGRNTGAPLMVVTELINKWDEFSKNTQAQLLSESFEAFHCKRDWDRLRARALKENTNGM